jgi:hypothetical protein
MGGASDAAELIARIASLEAKVAELQERLDRLEAKRAHKDRREGEAEYQIGALIG